MRRAPLPDPPCQKFKRNSPGDVASIPADSMSIAIGFGSVSIDPSATSLNRERTPPALTTK